MIDPKKVTAECVAMQEKAKDKNDGSKKTNKYLRAMVIAATATDYKMRYFVEQTQGNLHRARQWDNMLDETLSDIGISCP